MYSNGLYAHTPYRGVVGYDVSRLRSAVKGPYWQICRPLMIHSFISDEYDVVKATGGYHSVCLAHPPPFACDIPEPGRVTLRIGISWPVGSLDDTSHLGVGFANKSPLVSIVTWNNCCHKRHRTSCPVCNQPLCCNIRRLLPEYQNMAFLVSDVLVNNEKLHQVLLSLLAGATLASLYTEIRG